MYNLYYHTVLSQRVSLVSRLDEGGLDAFRQLFPVQLRNWNGKFTMVGKKRYKTIKTITEHCLSVRL